MTKPEPPIEVIQWRERYKKAALDLPPKCCHTCEDYTDDGYCRHFQMEPPADFASTFDQCPEWYEKIPF